MTEMRQCLLAGMIRQMSASARLQSRALRLALMMEGGEFYSSSARWIMKNRLGISIGDYSYGDCFVPGAFPTGVTVGRYVSIGPGVRAFMRNHPMDRLSLHPFFYNHKLGFVANDNIPSASLEIGHDAWIGARTLILSGCTRIGIGAVIGAGSIVTKSIPDFAVAVGNPARIIRQRFTDAQRQRILESRWWEKSAAECTRHMPDMTAPLGENFESHPLLHSDQGSRTNNS